MSAITSESTGPTGVSLQAPAEVTRVPRPAVRGVAFEGVPARLDRLKVGGVGRARFEMAAGVGSLDRRDRSSLVRRPVSPSSVYPCGLSSHVRSKPIFRPRSYTYSCTESRAA